MKMERVIGCVSCGKPALLVGDEAPKAFPACFWCLAERRPGAAGLFLSELRTAERERVLDIIRQEQRNADHPEAMNALTFLAMRIREGN